MNKTHKKSVQVVKVKGKDVDVKVTEGIVSDNGVQKIMMQVQGLGAVLAPWVAYAVLAKMGLGGQYYLYRKLGSTIFFVESKAVNWLEVEA